MAAYGPKALQVCGEVADGFILQLADVDVAEWMIAPVRDAAAAAGRDPASITICVAAPAYVGDDREHMRDQCRWFGGMVGNHVADIVGRYGGDGSSVPKALTDYIAGREGYDYNEHGRAGNTHAEFVPDEIVDRFCILGPVDAHLERLRELRALGVDQFAIYLQHDDKDGTLEAYGETSSRRSGTGDPWVCPKCQRQFGRAKQSHECSPAMTLDEYFSTGPERERAIFEVVRDASRVARSGPLRGRVGRHPLQASADVRRAASDGEVGGAVVRAEPHRRPSAHRPEDEGRPAAPITS